MNVLRQGVVKGMEAIEVRGVAISFECKIKVPSGISPADRWDTGEAIDVLTMRLPITTDVNPGDLVAINIQFASPEQQRFTPALEVGADSDDDAVS